MSAEDASNLIVTPLAVRGRDGGAQLELGATGGPAFALRAGDGGSSRSPLIAVRRHRGVAATLSPHDLTGPARAIELVVSATGDRTHTLTAQGHDASEDGTGRGVPIIASTLTSGTGSGRRREDDVNLITGFHLTQDPVSGRMAPAIGARSGGNGVAVGSVVRHLTPLECERLQGAPDGWTDGQSDSARYRQLGNAVAVPVFAWVATRIARVDSAIRRGVAA